VFDEKLQSTLDYKKIKRNVSYKTLIRLELYKLEKHFMGEDMYRPFVAEWWLVDKYVIMVYDVGEERVGKVLKTGKKYLTWIQKSVFEGQITESKLEKLKTELKKIIEPEKDSIIFFKLREAYLTKKEIIGREKNDTSNII